MESAIPPAKLAKRAYIQNALKYGQSIRRIPI